MLHPVPATATAEAEDRTRDRVLNAVLEHGPVSAAELGDLLGFTPAAVRRHLDHLARRGVIEVKRVARAGAGARLDVFPCSRNRLSLLLMFIN